MESLRKPSVQLVYSRKLSPVWFQCDCLGLYKMLRRRVYNLIRDLTNVVLRAFVRCRIIPQILQCQISTLRVLFWFQQHCSIPASVHKSIPSRSSNFGYHHESSEREAVGEREGVCSPEGIVRFGIGLIRNK